MTKVCYGCKEEKPLTEFHKHKYTHDGRQSRCKLCWNIAAYKNYIPHPKIKRPQSISDRMDMLQRAKRRAKDKGLPFDLTLEDIIIPEICPVFNLPLARVKRGEDRSFTPSLDRIEPDKGYVKGNVVVVSLKANVMKNNGSLEDLMCVYNFYNNVYNDFT
jgi:hypothetical protein